MRGMAVFIGSISVWDTIGTLPPAGIDIVTLFRLAYCCVMGRKAPRKRLAYRVISAFTRVCDAHDTAHGCLARTRTFLGAPPTPRFGVGEAKEITPRATARRKRKAVVQRDKDGSFPNSSCAGLTRASIFFAKSFYEDGWIAGSSPAMTEWTDTRTVSFCRDLLDLRRALLRTQPRSVRNGRRGNFIVSGLLFTMKTATPTCRAAEALVSPH